jgi:hypothetical protein
LSQAECAAVLGVAVATFRTWDAGRRPAPEAIVDQARTLKAKRPTHDRVASAGTPSLGHVWLDAAGGYTEANTGRPVAALVYTRGQHTINVFVWPEASDAIRSSDARAIRGFHVRHWTYGGMSYWAVSDVNDAELDQFVHALQ